MRRNIDKRSSPTIIFHMATNLHTGGVEVGLYKPLSAVDIKTNQV